MASGATTVSKKKTTLVTIFDVREKRGLSHSAGSPNGPIIANNAITTQRRVSRLENIGSSSNDVPQLIGVSGRARFAVGTDRWKFVNWVAGCVIYWKSTLSFPLMLPFFPFDHRRPDGGALDHSFCHVHNELAGSHHAILIA